MLRHAPVVREVALADDVHMTSVLACDTTMCAFRGTTCMFCWSTMASDAQGVQRMENPGRRLMVTAPCLAASLSQRFCKKMLKMRMACKSSRRLKLKRAFRSSQRRQKTAGILLNVNAQPSMSQMLTITLQISTRQTVRNVKLRLSNLSQGWSLGIVNCSRVMEMMPLHQASVESASLEATGTGPSQRLMYRCLVSSYLSRYCLHGCGLYLVCIRQA